MSVTKTLVTILREHGIEITPALEADLSTWAEQHTENIINALVQAAQDGYANDGDRT